MAAIKLTKGNPINLTKEAPGLKNLTIGLGWDLSITTWTPRSCSPMRTTRSFSMTPP